MRSELTFTETQKPRVLPLALMALLACVLAVALAPSQAFANREISAPTRDDGTTMTVSDDITRIHVDKVDYGTREPVIGAKMQIIEQKTGEVVDEWVTDGTTHETDKRLNVKEEYILREVEAPEGYSKVEDTVFIPNEMEGTGVTIVSPNLDDPDASRYIDLADGFHVTLYDPHDDIINEIVRTEDREVPGEKVVNNKTKSATKSGQPKTGDNVPTIAVSALVGAVIVAAFLLLLARRRNRNSDEKE